MRGLPPRPADDGLPTTFGGWALLVAKGTLGAFLVWAWLVLFLTAFA
jgi:hypothetical protein